MSNQNNKESLLQELLLKIDRLPKLYKLENRELSQEKIDRLTDRIIEELKKGLDDE